MGEGPGSRPAKTQVHLQGGPSSAQVRKRLHYPQLRGPLLWRHGRLLTQPPGHITPCSCPLPASCYTDNTIHTLCPHGPMIWPLPASPSSAVTVTSHVGSLAFLGDPRLAPAASLGTGCFLYTSLPPVLQTTDSFCCSAVTSSESPFLTSQLKLFPEVNHRNVDISNLLHKALKITS